MNPCKNRVIGVETFPLLEIIDDDYSKLNWEITIDKYELPSKYDIRAKQVNVKRDITQLISAIKTGNVQHISDTLTKTHDIKTARPLFHAVAYKKDNVIDWLVENGEDVNQCDENQNTALHICAYYGYSGTIKKLLELGANPNNINFNGQTPFIVASQEGRTSVVNILLKCRIDINQKCQLGYSALHYAIHSGYDDIASKIISLNKCDLNIAATNGLTPIILCTFKKQVHLMKMLVNGGANLNKGDIEGRTALMAACFIGDQECIKFLVDNKADVNAKTITGVTALIYGAFKCHGKQMEDLLTQVDDFNHESDEGYTALIIAAHLKEIDLVKSLIVLKASVNVENRIGKTALMAASESGDLDIFKYLVKSGADLSKRSKNGIAPLHIAAIKNNLKIWNYLDTEGETFDDIDLIMAALLGNLIKVDEILRKTGNIQYKDELNRTPLMAASLKGHDPIVMYLIERGADVNFKNKNGVTALGYAVQGNHIIVQQCLLQQGALIDIIDTKGRTCFINSVLGNHMDGIKSLDHLGSNIYHKDEQGQNALILASEMGYFDIVQYLVFQGGRIESMSNCGKTAIHYAYQNGHKETFRWLMKMIKTEIYGHDQGQKLLEATEDGSFDEVDSMLKQNELDVSYANPNGITAMMKAVEAENIPMLEHLMQYGARVNYRSPLTGRSAVFKACLSGKHKSLKFLLEKGASPNTPDRAGRTPLMCAAQENHSEMIQVLHQCGAILNARDIEGWTALSFAAKNNNREAVEMLLNFGSWVDMRDRTGMTVLGLSAYFGNVKMVDLLIQHGANMDEQDYSGRTALIDASQESQDEVVKYLLEKGAAKNTTDDKRLSALDIAIIFEQTSTVTLLESYDVKSFGLSTLFHEGIERMSEHDTDESSERHDSSDSDDGIEYRRTILHEGSVDTVHDIDDRVIVYNRLAQKNEEEFDISNQMKPDIQPSNLFTICKDGIIDITLIEEAIGQDNDVNSPSPEGKYPLLIAAENRKTNVLLWLIAKGAAINLTDESGNTALIVASKNKDLNMVDCLLSNRADINVQNDDGFSAIHYACEDGPRNLVELLLSHKADINSQNKDGVTPLMLASEKGNAAVLTCLVQDPTIVNTRDTQNRTALAHSALGSSLRCEEIATLLCAAGAGVDDEDENGDTPLLLTLESGNIPVTSELLVNGANINHQNYHGETFLLKICENELCEVLGPILLKHIHKVNKNNLFTALLYLSTNHYWNALDFLLQDEQCLMIWRERETSLFKSVTLQSSVEGFKYFITKADSYKKVKTLMSYTVDFLKEAAMNIVQEVSDYITTIDKYQVCANSLKILLKEGLYYLVGKYIQSYSHQYCILLGKNEEHNDCSDCCSDGDYSKLDKRIWMNSTCVNPPVAAKDSDLDGNTDNEVYSSDDDQYEENISDIKATSKWSEMENQEGLSRTKEPTEWLEYQHEDASTQWLDSSFPATPTEYIPSLVTENVPGIAERWDSSWKPLVNGYNSQEHGSSAEWIDSPLQLNSTKQVEYTRKIESMENHLSTPVELRNGQVQENPDHLYDSNEEDDISEQKIAQALEELRKVEEDVNAARERKDMLQKRIKDVEQRNMEHHEKKLQLEAVIKAKEEEIAIAKKETEELKQKLSQEQSENTQRKMEHEHKSETEMHLLPEMCSCKKDSCKVCNPENESIKKDKSAYVKDILDKENFSKMLSSFHKETHDKTKHVDTSQQEEEEIEVIKTPGVIREEKRKKQERAAAKDDNGECKCGNCDKCISPRLEYILEKTHPNTDPCGKCLTCLNARTIMINYLGFKAPKPEGPYYENDNYQGNQRYVITTYLAHKPHPKLYLFKFHASVSQSSIDGQNVLSTACAIIAMLFAHKFLLDPSVFPEKPPLYDVPDKVFDQVEASIREGNETHAVNFKGQPVNLGPDEITLLTSHLGISLLIETDVDTREPDTLVQHIMDLQPKQVIMFIKNCKVVSIVPCNDNKWILLFDSHPHFEPGMRGLMKLYGTYIFYVKKENEALKELVKLYDDKCDPIPFYGKFAIFDCN